jgi:hypothetical protein
MKCEVCLELLEEYLDGELAAEDREQIDAHLITCSDCSESFAALTAEQQIFARYDREIEVSPFLWTRVAAHTVSKKEPSASRWRGWLAEMFATPGAVMAVAIILFAVAVLVPLTYPEVWSQLVKGDRAQVTKSQDNSQPVTPKTDDKEQPTASHDDSKPAPIASLPKRKPRVRPTTTITSDQSDVLSSDLGYLDMDDQDTANHIEQSKLLLRSIKNVAIADNEDEIDVTYDKALSRRLLNENVVLRRDAEMKAKFPTKTLLADLEPFLIDIANLPDRARAEDVRVIKERVQKTEIVAALVDYQDRGTNNR